MTEPHVIVARDRIGTIVHLPGERVLAILDADATPDQIEHWLHTQHVGQASEVLAAIAGSEPRTFDMPKVPKNLHTVRDSEGVIWARQPRTKGRVWKTLDSPVQREEWPNLIYHYGPLTEVSQ